MIMKQKSTNGLRGRILTERKKRKKERRNKKRMNKKRTTLAGFEPAIFRSEVGRLSH
jgi:hypothetical protein